MTGEFEGQGGTYLLDPTTGQRTLLRRTSAAPRGGDEIEPRAPDTSAQPEAEPIHETEKDTP